jgi:hypothetical protein
MNIREARSAASRTTTPSATKSPTIRRNTPQPISKACADDYCRCLTTFAMKRTSLKAMVRTETTDVC